MAIAIQPFLCHKNFTLWHNDREYDNSNISSDTESKPDINFTVLILGLHPANNRRRYKVTPYFIGWAQT